MKTKTEYFDALYFENHDPWGYENRWYEERKRNVCLALLLKPIYNNALEIGCANGVFSQHLALRCKNLLCIDANETAVDLAQARLSHLNHVNVIQAMIPETFPEQKFDLIVLGEVLYYLNHDELMSLIEKIHRCLSDDGVVLCCHWRYPIEYFSLTGDHVHQVLKENIQLYHYLSLQDPDFNVDIWAQEGQSVADREGLI